MLIFQVERERAGKRMLEKQSLIVENTLKTEEAKVKILEIFCNTVLQLLAGEGVQRDDGEAVGEVEEAGVRGEVRDGRLQRQRSGQ